MTDQRDTHFQVRCDPALQQAVRAYAGMNGMSVRGALEFLLRLAFGNIPTDSQVGIQ